MEDRDIALGILRRAPLDLSRRASYGEEQRTEVVTAHWEDGQRRTLSQRRDDRISFALRDRFEQVAAPCRFQLEQLAHRHGPPTYITVAWEYRANWEGERPVDARGQCRLAWSEVATLLDLNSRAGYTPPGP